MKKTFNLKKHIKKAFYEDDRGYMQDQSRAWMNCYKQKCDMGKSPQEAWNECKDEYQTSKKDGNWAIKYTSMKDDTEQKYFDAKTPYAEKIK